MASSEDEPLHGSEHAPLTAPAEPGQLRFGGAWLWVPAGTAVPAVAHLNALRVVPVRLNDGCQPPAACAPSPGQFTQQPLIPVPPPPPEPSLVTTALVASSRCRPPAGGYIRPQGTRRGSRPTGRRLRPAAPSVREGAEGAYDAGSDSDDGPSGAPRRPMQPVPPAARPPPQRRRPEEMKSIAAGRLAAAARSLAEVVVNEGRSRELLQNEATRADAHLQAQAGRNAAAAMSVASCITSERVQRQGIEGLEAAPRGAAGARLARAAQLLAARSAARAEFAAAAVESRGLLVEAEAAARGSILAARSRGGALLAAFEEDAVREELIAVERSARLAFPLLLDSILWRGMMILRSRAAAERILQRCAELAVVVSNLASERRVVCQIEGVARAVELIDPEHHQMSLIADAHFSGLYGIEAAGAMRQRESELEELRWDLRGGHFAFVMQADARASLVHAEATGRKLAVHKEQSQRSGLLSMLRRGDADADASSYESGSDGELRRSAPGSRRSSASAAAPSVGLRRDSRRSSRVSAAAESDGRQLSGRAEAWLRPPGPPGGGLTLESGERRWRTELEGQWEVAASGLQCMQECLNGGVVPGALRQLRKPAAPPEAPPEAPPRILRAATPPPVVVLAVPSAPQPQQWDAGTLWGCTAAASPTGRCPLVAAVASAAQGPPAPEAAPETAPPEQWRADVLWECAAAASPHRRCPLLTVVADLLCGQPGGLETDIRQGGAAPAAGPPLRADTPAPPGPPAPAAAAAAQWDAGTLWACAAAASPPRSCPLVTAVAEEHTQSAAARPAPATPAGAQWGAAELWGCAAAAGPPGVCPLLSAVAAAAGNHSAPDTRQQWDGVTLWACAAQSSPPRSCPLLSAVAAAESSSSSGTPKAGGLRGCAPPSLLTPPSAQLWDPGTLWGCAAGAAPAGECPLLAALAQKMQEALQWDPASLWGSLAAAAPPGACPTLAAVAPILGAVRRRSSAPRSPLRRRSVTILEP